MPSAPTIGPRLNGSCPCRAIPFEVSGDAFAVDARHSEHERRSSERRAATAPVEHVWPEGDRRSFTVRALDRTRRRTTGTRWTVTWSIVDVHLPADATVHRPTVTRPDRGDGA